MGIQIRHCESMLSWGWSFCQLLPHLWSFRAGSSSSAPSDTGNGLLVCFVLSKLHGKVLNILLDSHNVAQNWFLQVQTGWLRWNSLGNGHHLTTRIFSSAHQEFKWLFYSQHIKSSLQLKQRGGPLVWTPVEHPKGIKGELSDYSTTGMEKLSLLESPHRGTA